MAIGDKPPDGFIPRLRAVAAAVGIVLIVFLVGADTLGRLFLDPNFHIGDFIFGTLAGLVATLLGIESLVRLAGK